MKPVVYTKLAEREIEAAAVFFEGRKEGLGVQFYERIDQAKRKIELKPEGFQKIYKDMHHVNLEQFSVSPWHCCRSPFVSTRLRLRNVNEDTGQSR